MLKGRLASKYEHLSTIFLCILTVITIRYQTLIIYTRPSENIVWGKLSMGNVRYFKFEQTDGKPDPLSITLMY